MKIEDILDLYKQNKRHYHSIEHINFILSKIDKQDEILILATIFHDCIYDVTSNDNEEKSCELFKIYATLNNIENFIEPVCNLIMSTKHDRESTILSKLDLLDLLTAECYSVLDGEDRLFKEYQEFPLKKYVDGRINFLNNMIKIYPSHQNVLQQRIEYVRNKEYKIGLYVGSFNPFHIGHLNVLNKAKNILDKVIVVQMQNLEKKKSEHELPFGLNGTESLLSHSNIFSLIDNFNNLGLNISVYIVRGIRDDYDLKKELEYKYFIEKYCENINFLYILADEKYRHISSSNIRQLIKFNKDVSEFLV